MMIKLSEAIRVGAALRPQAFYNYIQLRDGMYGTCALGAAYEAATSTLPLDITPLEVYNVLAHTFGMAHGEFAGIITHWNDELKLTREEIADRLDVMGV